MGAWHHNPYENDSALDWLGIVEGKIVAEISKVLKMKGDCSYHEKVAAAQLLVDLSTPKNKPCVAYEAYERGVYILAIEVVGNIAEDSGWLQSWKDPTLVFVMLRKLRQRLRLIRIREMRRRVVKAIRKRKGIVIIQNPKRGKVA